MADKVELKDNRLIGIKEKSDIHIDYVDYGDKAGIASGEMLFLPDGKVVGRTVDNDNPTREMLILGSVVSDGVVFIKIPSILNKEFPFLYKLTLESADDSIIRCVGKWDRLDRIHVWEDMSFRIPQISMASALLNLCRSDVQVQAPIDKPFEILANINRDLLLRYIYNLNVIEHLNERGSSASLTIFEKQK